MPQRLRGTLRDLPSGRVQARLRPAGLPPLAATFDTSEEAKAWAEAQAEARDLHGRWATEEELAAKTQSDPTP